MASGNGASLSPVRHSLLHLLRSSSKPFLADRNPLISSPLPMARKKEGRFASVAPRRRRRRRTRQPRRPRGLIRTGSVTGRGGRRSGRRRGGVVMAATSGARLVFHLPPRRRWTVLYRTVGWRGAGGRMPPTGLIQSLDAFLWLTPHLPISGVHQEHTSAFMDSSLELDAPLFGHDLLSSGHLHNLPMYRQTPSRLEEELLELGDRIGHVSTGLKEEEIIGSLRKVKHSFFYALKRFFSTEIDGKCSICQEEYEANDEIGELDCGHSYHVFCIKQWLLQNNVCPVSKTSVPRT
uniref:RING-type E3 ubiquitin transferase n=1 Tax=Musa acuminata subsp. malaccensis TaxID=214687 RepID=A0A804HUW6_MUSAM